MCDAPLDLVWEDQSARVCLDGGRLVSYRVGSREVLESHQDPAGPYVYRSSLLVPWPNRVADGRWVWEGEELQLEVNEPSRRCALHGLVDRARFGVVSHDAASAVLSYDLQPSRGYPFPLRVRASYGLGPAGLVSYLEAENRGATPAPVALGVHPYVATGLVDDVVLTLPARTLPVLDEQWLEQGRVPVHGPYDFTSPRPLGSVELDTAFTDLVRSPSGRVEVVLDLPDGVEVLLWSGETCRWLVVFTSDTLLPAERRRSLVVEPMTANANAFRSGVDLDVLAPGDVLRLDWGLVVSLP